MKGHDMLRSFILIAGLCAVSACDVATHPVAVVGPSATVYRGTATATLFEGGWFHVTNGGNTCRGQYQPGVSGDTVTFPVSCTNGLTGIGTAVYQTPLQGGGEIVMQDGSRWQFIFGRGALGV